MSEPIRVLVVDDHPLFRQGVIQSLNKAGDITVVGEAQDGREAVRKAIDLLPDVILLDISMPGGSGLEAVRALSDAVPVSRIIMLTVSEDEDTLLAALKSGARGYLLKGVSGEELQRVVRAVYNGEVYVAPAIASSLLLEMARPRSAASPAQQSSGLDELTEREREILELVARGHTNREIGQKLFLSEKTVKHYMTNILQKLQVRSRVEAALLAQRQGLGERR
jgi:two-component system nitrate/nitrite response regulator NarL